MDIHKNRHKDRHKDTKVTKIDKKNGDLKQIEAEKKTQIWTHKDTGTQRHMDTKTQGHKDTGGTQRHRRERLPTDISGELKGN